jgi:hypothetical protein
MYLRRFKQHLTHQDERDATQEQEGSPAAMRRFITLNSLLSAL